MVFSPFSKLREHVRYYTRLENYDPIESSDLTLSSCERIAHCGKYKKMDEYFISVIKM